MYIKEIEEEDDVVELVDVVEDDVDEDYDVTEDG